MSRLPMPWPQASPLPKHSRIITHLSTEYGEINERAEKGFISCVYFLTDLIELSGYL